MAGREDELLARARTGDLAVLREMADELLQRAENGDVWCANCLVDLLAKRDDLTDLRVLADRGIHKARKRLVGAMERRDEDRPDW